MLPALLPGATRPTALHIPATRLLSPCCPSFRRISRTVNQVHLLVTPSPPPSHLLLIFVSQDLADRQVHLLESLNPGACVLPIASGQVDPGAILFTGVCGGRGPCHTHGTSPMQSHRKPRPLSSYRLPHPSVNTCI